METQSLAHGTTGTTIGARLVVTSDEPGLRACADAGVRRRNPGNRATRTRCAHFQRNPGEVGNSGGDRGAPKCGRPAHLERTLSSPANHGNRSRTPPVERRTPLNPPVELSATVASNSDGKLGGQPATEIPPEERAAADGGDRGIKLDGATQSQLYVMDSRNQAAGAAGGRRRRGTGGSGRRLLQVALDLFSAVLAHRSDGGAKSTKPSASATRACQRQMPPTRWRLETAVSNASVAGGRGPRGRPAVEAQRVAETRAFSVEQNPSSSVGERGRRRLRGQFIHGDGTEHDALVATTVDVEPSAPR